MFEILNRLILVADVGAAVVVVVADSLFFCFYQK